jgi:hypothetical protein
MKTRSRSLPVVAQWLCGFLALPLAAGAFVISEKFPQHQFSNIITNSIF